MTDPHVPDGTRLQKVLASAGVGSRRACEELIAQGRVKVNGQVVRVLGTRVDPDSVVLHVDDMRVMLDDSLLTMALNKPKGVVSTMDDEHGRPDLTQYVQDRKERLFHVGRLDTDTEGLILLTNDGELAHRLAHPSYEVPKTYVAVVEGIIKRSTTQQLRSGITLEDGEVNPVSFKVMEQGPEQALVQITLVEGRKHIVRRALQHVGHPVQRLTRTRFATIRLSDLKSGRTRVIAGNELAQLMKVVGM